MSRAPGEPGPFDARREVEEEVEDYLRRRAGELEAEGMDPVAARRAAEDAFGDVEAIRRTCVRIQRRRRVREAVSAALAGVATDLRLGIRGLVRRPGFAAVAVLTLGLGVGANAALFSVVDTVLLRPLPYPEPQRLVQMWESDPRRPVRSPSPADYLDVRRVAHSFQDLAAYNTVGGSLSGDGEPEAVRYASVTGNFFRTLGIDARLGSTFGPDAVAPGVRVAVLSDGLWRRRFGGDPGVVGQRLRVDGVAYAIAGVMPPTFSFPADIEFWVAAPGDVPGSPFFDGDPRPIRDAWYHDVVGRLAPGVTLAQANQEMSALAGALAAEYPGPDEGLGIRLVSLRDETLGDVGPTLWLLLGATGLVLLVACSNVANLLLVRGMGRRGEMAVRTALGAGRHRLTAQILTEAVVLAAAGGVVGAVVAVGGLTLLRPTVTEVLPRGSELHVDVSVLGFAALAAAATALLFGWIPARSAATSTAVRTARGGTPSGRARALGDGLVAAEVAMAVVLVLGAGLLLRSVARVAAVDLGFDTESLTVAWVGLPSARDAAPEERVAFYREVGEHLSALPGVTGAAWTQASPLRAGPGAGLRVADAELRDGNDLPDVRWQVVSPEYFQVAGVRLLAGRGFTPADGPDAEAVGLVSASLARQVFGDADPVGRRVNTGLDGRLANGQRRWVTVVGVVADTRNRGPTRAPDPVLYRPLAQGGPGFPGTRLMALVRSGGQGPELAASVRRAVWAVDPDAPVSGLARGTELAEGYTGQRGLALLLLGIFGALALCLGAVGTYGVTSFAVRQRTRELGVRVALGADRGGVVALVLRQGLLPVGGGLVAGTVAGAALSRVLASLLFEVAPLDPVTFAVVPLLLLAVSGLAVWIPARRAARVDPMVSLRTE